MSPIDCSAQIFQNVGTTQADKLYGDKTSRRRYLEVVDCCTTINIDDGLSYCWIVMCYSLYLCRCFSLNKTFTFYSLNSEMQRALFNNAK